ncbi:MAG: AAA domain-containing protein, partial [Motilibacteraceae bacterium]
MSGSWAASTRTGQLVETAAEAWRRGLVDISAGNKRLYYSPLKVGTLRLADAAPAPFARLLAGDAVRLGDLVPDDGTPDGIARAGGARRAADLLAAKGKIGEEETGDNPVRLALGLATWAPEQPVASGPGGARKERHPAAPLLLAPVAFTLIPGTRSVSSLQLTGEPELNTALRFLLRAHFDVNLDAEAWLAEAVDPDGVLNAERLLKAATRLAGRVPGWQVDEHAVVDSFGSDRELMLRDLEDEALLAAHPLLAAMAGDREAQALVRGGGLPDDGSDLSAPDTAPPSLEHLVLDADASQQAVISHALAGRNLVVQGPPGTGKSQTIANLLAEAMAAGKTVLFVAQKRAAVDAVMTRLDDVGLAGNVLEVFDSKTKRGNVIAQLRSSLERLSTVAAPDTAALHRDLTIARDRLVTHARSLHTPRQELAGGTVYDLLGRIAAIPALPQTSLRLPFTVVRGWQGERLDELAAAVAEFTTLGGLDPDRASRSGWNVDTVTTERAATDGYDAAAAVSSSWNPVRGAATQALASVGLAAPTTLDQARAGVQLLTDTAAVLQVFQPQILDPAVVDAGTLARLTAAVGSKAERKSLPDKVGLFERRRLRKQLIALLRQDTSNVGMTAGRDDAGLHQCLVAVAGVRQQWAVAPRRDTGDAGPVPSASVGLPQAHAALGEITGHLARLAPLTQHLSLDALPWAELPAQLSLLLADPRRAVLPRAHALHRTLLDAGAGPVLEQLADRVANGQDVDPV